MGTAIYEKIGAFKIIQGPLVAVASGIGLNLLFRNYENLKLGAEQVVDIPVAESFSKVFELFTTSKFSAITDPDVIVIGVTIAIVASLETLCVEATDNQSSKENHSD